MQLLRVQLADGVGVEGEIEHEHFGNWLINGSPGRESDIEELLIRHPGLLNFGDFDPTMQSNAEVLIVAQQPTTSNRKRADLFGVHRDGSLVVIEIKRDAVDERGRSEGLEFQAIRYAAASRKLTAAAVIGMFAKFLRARGGSTAAQDVGDDYWRSRAVNLLSEHLADEDEEPNESDLERIINPKEKQKIYLVAAGYEADVTAACAWLRQHNIDISSFRLRPYTIAGQKVIERQRLIPPPELDEFMEDTFSSSSGAVAPRPSSATRSASNKPVTLTWSDADSPILISTWRALAEQVVTRALLEGFDVDALPMRTSAEEGVQLRTPVPIEGLHLLVDLHGSADTIKSWIDRILKAWDKGVGLTVETTDGEPQEFPRIQGNPVPN